MELKDLKSAWSKFSSSDANRHQLGEEAIYDLLRKRTKSLMERIDRNIKIGFGVLLLLTLFFGLDDYLFTPLATSDYESTPLWIQLMEWSGILFIVGSFIYFWISYRSATKDYSQSNDLSRVLNSMIRILYAYQRLFFLALGILLLVLSISFVTGMVMGVELKAIELGTDVGEVGSSPRMVRSILIGIAGLLVIISLLFVAFRWGFRKLYGNYISKLKDTRKELDEIE
ncbi:hypothetical protein ACRTDU_12690 [Sunxiuqinia elliptica]|uniref:Uncharacterized protein n=1 Tax=Sunxiuqinia elliptica TaxID=655355 RepID=A0A1I2F5X7_9BACT|nr:hypothetical protein [Sunxiuqinia elliptica]SFF00752.1 hypothetical protein SAMN05216283_102374 [Sunxiuqinia elliptica]